MEKTIPEIHRMLRTKVIGKIVFYVLYLLFTKNYHLNNSAEGWIAKSCLIEKGKLIIKPV